MTTPRILVEHANHLPVGDPKSGQVALGPLIDAKQRDRVHAMVSDIGLGRARRWPPVAPTRSCSIGRRC